MLQKLLCALLLTNAMIVCKSQALVITGKIVDSISRQPLESANIEEDGNQKNRALTDATGNFLIKIDHINSAIKISYVGYKNIAVKVTDKKPVKIEMQPAAVDLENIIITQNGATQNFTSLAKLDLDLKPVKNTQELLRIVPGLFVAQHAGGGKAEQIFLRGFDCDHGTDISVSVDGLPVNMVSHAHGQGYADAHFIIAETINTIDYGSGPYYAAQGNLNTAGYVSFSTFNNISKSILQVEAGRFNTFRTVAMVDLLKKDKDRQSAYVAAEFNYTNGPTINPQNFNRFNVFGKYNLAISASTHLTTSLSAFKSKWDASGQVPTRAVEQGLIDRFGSIDPSEGGNTERYNANVELTHCFSNGARIANQAYYSRYIFNLYSNFSFYLHDPINGDEINQAEKRNVFGYNWSFSNKKINSNSTLNSSYAAGIRYDAINNSYLAHAVKRRLLNDLTSGDIDQANAFAYTQQQLAFDKWSVDAGLRFDYFYFKYKNKLFQPEFPSQAKSILSPKLSIGYKLARVVQLYVKAGKGFHSNDARVVVADDGHSILPAAYATDVGVIFKPTSKFFLNVAAWQLHLAQEFVYVGDDGNIEPSSKTSRKGIDIIARYQFTSSFFANANINFTKARFINQSKGNDYVPLAPSSTSTGGVFYKKKEGLNGGLMYRFIKDRPANEDNSIVAKGYFLIDGCLNYTKAKYEVGIAVENVLNTKWNEAQFATTSRLLNEASPVTELNFTPGSPFFIKAKLAAFF
jgi:hypothetical protein